MNKKIIVTGGLGFIGSNASSRFLRTNDVCIVDNMSKSGSESNYKHIFADNHSVDEHLFHIPQNILHPSASSIAASKIPFLPDCIVHLAGQTAVTTSIDDPANDFENNLHGTIRMLEYARAIDENILFIFSSTNKVYGSLGSIELKELDTRYVPIDGRNLGVDEDRPLDFHTPYGCSKGAADQYVLDYARNYNITSVVFRQSCIYGGRSYPTEDQGWVSWIVKQALLGNTINIYGTGKQVRDILHVDDLVSAYCAVLDEHEAGRLSGPNVYNIGGGVDNSISVLELVFLLEKILNKTIPIKFFEERKSDQKYYVSDFSKFESEFDWSPQYNIEAGIKQTIEWWEGVL